MSEHDKRTNGITFQRLIDSGDPFELLTELTAPWEHDEDWVELSDKFRDAYNDIFLEEVEKHSVMDAFLARIAATAWNAAMNQVASRFGMTGHCLESCLELDDGKASIPPEWVEARDDWDKAIKF